MNYPFNSFETRTPTLRRRDRQWDYYELRSEASRCARELRCAAGGKCLRPEQLCDGRDDCGDGADEESCPEDKRPNVGLRLAGGRSPNEGRLEIRQALQ